MMHGQKNIKLNKIMAVYVWIFMFLDNSEA